MRGRKKACTLSNNVQKESVSTQTVISQIEIFITDQKKQPRILLKRLEDQPLPFSVKSKILEELANREKIAMVNFKRRKRRPSLTRKTILTPIPELTVENREEHSHTKQKSGRFRKASVENTQKETPKMTLSRKNTQELTTISIGSVARGDATGHDSLVIEEFSQSTPINNRIVEKSQQLSPILWEDIDKPGPSNCAQYCDNLQSSPVARELGKVVTTDVPSPAIYNDNDFDDLLNTDMSLPNLILSDESDDELVSERANDEGKSLVPSQNYCTPPNEVHDEEEVREEDVESEESIRTTPNFRRYRRIPKNRSINIYNSTVLINNHYYK